MIKQAATAARRVFASPTNTEIAEFFVVFMLGTMAVFEFARAAARVIGHH